MKCFPDKERPVMRYSNERELYYIAAWGLLAAGPTATAEMVIVESGQPQATIVVPNSAPGPAKKKIQTAAADLQAYVKKISGAKLPIVDDEQDPAGALILVGRSRISESLGLVIPAGVRPAGTAMPSASLSRLRPTRTSGPAGAC